MLNEWNAAAENVRHKMHSFSQPLAILQCRLEMGSIAGTEFELREAVQGGLEDLRRVAGALQELREAARALPTREERK